MGRRAAVVATASGILVSTFASTAHAAPAENTATKVSTVDLGALTQQARAALEAAPTVTVPADAQVEVEVVSAETAVKVEPAPAPAPVVTARTATASRSAERTSNTVGAPEVAAQSAAASLALRYVGVAYVLGGASPSGLDCSGLVSYVYAQLGIDLPHQSRSIRDSARTTQISRAEAQPGDLIWSPGHVSIYLGDGMQVEATRPQVRVHSIWQSNPVFLRVS